VDVTAPRHLALDLHRATALVDRVADLHLRAVHGIGISGFAALVSIDAVGPARQSAVATALGVSRAAVSQRLGELVTRGLVDVSPDPSHGRANLVSLTPAGRRLLAAGWQSLARSEDGLETGVDLDGLQAGLVRLIANAEHHLASRARA
jgi:DNA-binding MarR family transcriptional regulator